MTSLLTNLFTYIPLSAPCSQMRAQDTSKQGEGDYTEWGKGGGKLHVDRRLGASHVTGGDAATAT
jgi:hypothetical protein